MDKTESGWSEPKIIDEPVSTEESEFSLRLPMRMYYISAE